jgi:CRISPR-associated endonuclease Cas2
MDNPGWYLVAYDIADPKRLSRLHRRLRRDGLAMQKSVFLVQRSQRGIGELMDELDGLIHRREDDLRAYPIPEPGEIWLRGKGVVDGSVLAPGAKARKRHARPATRPWWRRLLGAK